jgi:hypothetical protein
MCLIDSDEACADAAQESEGAARGKPFGGHVEKLDAAIVKAGKDIFSFFVGVARGEGARADARFAQCADLIAHERNQRRDDDGDAFAQKGGKLETQRFAAACRHDGERVAPLGHGPDDLGLSGAEGGESKDRGETLLGGGHGVWSPLRTRGRRSLRS